jgi:hypothetical protein
MPNKQANPTFRSAQATPISTPSLTTRITELVQACFTGIWLETREPEEATRELTQLARSESWRLALWDCDSGLKFPCDELPVPTPADTTDPLAVIRAAGQFSQGSNTTLLVLQNFHRFLGPTEILQAVQKQVSSGKHTRTFIVILSPVVHIPVENQRPAS